MRRRTFLGNLAAAPAAAALVPLARQHRWTYEHVLGTSMELTVRADRAVGLRAGEAVVDEIERLDQVLSTYRADSEISRLGDQDLAQGSPERAAVLAQYAEWHCRSGGAISTRINGRLNVDALGKAFIIDRAAGVAMRAGAEGVILNIGGDIVTAGRPADVLVTDPARFYENDAPLTRVRGGNLAIASSGSYARPGHLIDPRTGGPALGASSATVMARDCVTANALATALCVMAVPGGLDLVEQSDHAEAIVIARDGRIERTTGFRSYEQTTSTKPVTPAWPAGYEMRIELTLTGQAGNMRGRGSKSPYVAIWVEDTRGKYVRTLAVWGQQWRYLGELIDWWAIARNDRALNTTSTRATRPAGQYRVAWNGLDDAGDQVAPGAYKINVEVSREHGTYARKTAAITCAATPASITLPETAEFAPIVITYGPRS